MLYKHARRRGTYIHCQAHRGGESARAAPLLTLPLLLLLLSKVRSARRHPKPLARLRQDGGPSLPHVPQYQLNHRIVVSAMVAAKEQLPL